MYFDLVVSKNGKAAFISDHRPEDMIKAVAVDHGTGFCSLEYANRKERCELEVHLCEESLTAIAGQKSAVFAYFDTGMKTFRDIYFIELKHQPAEGAS